MTPTNFPFGQEIKSYNTGEMVTPYQKQGQFLDKPVGEFLHNAYLWRLGFIIASCASLFLLFIFILQLNSSPFTTYVLSVTKSGFLKQASVLENSYNIPAKSYEKFLMKGFIGALQQGMPNKAEKTWYLNFVSPKAKAHIAENFSIHDANEKTFKLHRFQIDNANYFKGVLTYDNEAGFIRRFNITGRVRHATPQTHELVMLNPLGFYLYDINFLPVSLDPKFRKKVYK